MVATAAPAAVTTENLLPISLEDFRKLITTEKLQFIRYAIYLGNE